MNALPALLLIAFSGTLLADTTWTNGGDDSSWSDAANWSNGVPGLSATDSNVTIGTQPTNNLIGVDTGVANTGVESLTFSPSLTADVQFVAAGVEQLTIFTNLSNDSARLITFSLPVTAGGQEAGILYYATGGGLEFDGGFNVGLSQVSVSGTGAITLGNGAYTTIAIQDGSTYGAFEGTGTVAYNDTNLQFNFSDASPAAGTSWQLFAATAGSVASVSFVGDNLSGSLDEVSSGFWSGYVGDYFWTFDESSGILSSGSAPALAITTQTPLAEGTTQVFYSGTLSASYGTSPYQWTVTSGSLPAGLSLTSLGLLSGTPGASGTFAFTVQVKDQASNAATKAFTLAIVSPLIITSASPLPAGIEDDGYSQTLAGGGGEPSYRWSLASGSLPAGLTLGSSGLLSGTPSASGTFNFVAKIMDSGGASATGAFSLDIVSQLVISSSQTLGTGVVGDAYSATLAAGGGATPYAWSLSGGSLPGGLSLAQGGLISGTPASTGTFGFTAEVSDGSGQVKSQAFAIAVVEPLAVTAATLDIGVSSVAYSQALAATGGVPPYQWSLDAGTLPSGIALSGSGVLTGTPSKTGTFGFVAKVRDNSGTIATGAFSIAVVAPLTITSASPITSGSVSYNYSQTFTAGGGVTPYTWSVSGGSLPGGLSLSTTGTLSGIPANSGTYSFTAEVMDSNGSSNTKNFTVAIAATLMPNGTVGAFIGLIDRQRAVNGGLGGRLDLTTTAAGKVTGKITQDGHSRSFKGSVTPTGGSEPEVNLTVANGTSPSLQLTVSLDGTANQLSGTVTTDGTSAAVYGWRQVWNKKTNPATALAGYYSFILSLSDTSDQNTVSIPQGNGFGKFTVGPDGTLRIIGKTADGQAFSTAGFVGPNGEIAVYQSLYSNKGSLLGQMAIATGSANADNTIGGSLTWLKPAGAGRAYAAGFGPISLTASGGYLAPAASGHVVLGLPDSTATASLLFADGGLSAAAINPDVNAFTFTAANKVVMPAAGTPENPAKATLTINAATGAVSGKYTLVDGKLTRVVTYQGMIVPSLGGGVEAGGYFLLPQIPADGESTSTSPILSGQVSIQQ
jgi:hypothetical protein